MEKIPFNEDELKIVGYEENRYFGKMPVLNFPVTPKEAYRSLLFDHKPVWMPIGSEQKSFTPSVIPDNIARGFVFEQNPYPRDEYGGKDMFGIDWVFVEQVGGSMVKPGSPAMEDVNDWKEVIKFPDIDSWDWAGAAEANKDFFNTDKFICMTLLNGAWFERLISFMDFEGAAMALLDEDQEDALHELLHKTTDLNIAIIDKAFEYFPIDGICIHDDWGSQMAPFFSEDAARTFFLDEMKRLVKHVHDKGYPIELHSCGHNESRVDIFVEAGFDAWSPMPMNDTANLYDTVGDKMAIGLTSVEIPVDPATASDEEIIQAAIDYVDRFTVPGKLALPGRQPIMNNELFKKTVYEESRKRYLEW